MGVSRGRRRVFAVTVMLSLLSSHAAASPEPPSEPPAGPSQPGPMHQHTQAVPHAVAASDLWLERINWWRSLGAAEDGSPWPMASNPPALNTGPQNHVDYLASIYAKGSSYCNHYSDPAYPKTPGVDYSHNVLFCGMSSLTAAVDGWMATPLHSAPLLDPGVREIGGGLATTTVAGRGTFHAAAAVAGGANPLAKVYLWPKNGGSVPRTTWWGGESPDPSAACPPEAGVINGQPVSAWFPATRKFVSLNVSDDGGTIPACVLNFDKKAAVGTPLRTFEIFPQRPWRLGHQATVQLVTTAADGSDNRTTTWTFTAIDPPQTPTGLRASASRTTFTLTWTAPNGQVIDYIVEYSADGVTWTTYADGVSTTPSASVSGLPAGTPMRFRVSTKNAFGTSSPTPPVGPVAPVAGFSSVGPARVFDTRPGTGGLRSVPKTRLAAGDVLKVAMAGLPDLTPPSGVAAVGLNVTATGGAAPGYITVFPCGTRPEASSLNFATGDSVPNLVIAPVSAAGEVCFYSSAPVDLIADINGWFATSSTLTPVGPARLFDTRPGNAAGVPGIRLATGNTMQFQVTGLSGLTPTSGVGGVVLNVTATGATGDGYVTVYPCGTRPEASNLNFVVGQTIPNAVVTPVSPSGAVCFYSSTKVDLVADINGWFGTDAMFTSVSPARVFDTRTGTGGIRTVPKGRLAAGTRMRVTVTGLTGKTPTTGVAAAALNVTATSASGAGYVTVYPCGMRPEASNLNFAAGQTIANAVIAPVSVTGEVCLYSSVDVHLIADINGWFGA